jgi:hypothetical protein
VDNIKMDIREMEGGDKDWIDLIHIRDQWRLLMNTIMNLPVFIKCWEVLE